MRIDGAIQTRFSNEPHGRIPARHALLLDRVPVFLLLRSDGLLSRLSAKGFVVEAPVY